MAKYFGTDGIRGRAGELLTPQLALALGGAAAAALTQGEGSKRLLIGKDTRLSCDMLEAALAAGLMAAGVDVLQLGVIATPGVAALCRAYDAPGVVISASHNPYYDNGIKFFSAEGLKLPDEAQERIEYLLEHPQTAASPHMGRMSVVHGASMQYAEALLTRQKPDLSGVKLVVDCANGAAAPLAERLLQTLGAEVIALFAEPDGYNINEGCGSTHPELLQRTVVEQGARLGLALDGDADRLIAVDELGNLVDGDMLLTVMARHMKSAGHLANNCVVVSQMCNTALVNKLCEQGITVEQSKVGDRYVLEKMQQTGAVLGGEQSGHLILSKFNSTGDALAAALYLLTIMVESGQSLGQLTADLTPFPQVHINVPVQSKDGWDTDADIGAAIAAAEQELLGQGRVVVRASGTEPLLRVMTEGPDQAVLERLSQSIADMIGQKLG